MKEVLVKGIILCAIVAFVVTCSKNIPEADKPCWTCGDGFDGFVPM